MPFDYTKSRSILAQTPLVLKSLLSNYKGSLEIKESEQAYTPINIVSHLINGEKTDWILRMRIILGDQDKNFPPFDREGFMGERYSMPELLEKFQAMREDNLRVFEQLFDEDKLGATGIHPAFGEVTLEQHLSTWVVHDLNHLYQLIRTLAKEYKSDVGPWIDYLHILRE